jgi:DNA-binding NtrC family response regulator
MALILCIDDCENGLTVRKLVLESHGHTVLTALTAAEGLQHFMDHAVELVISDHCLKEKCGTEIAKEMKRHKPEVPFILLTGRLDPPEDIRSIDVFLTKGGGPQQLLEVVSDLLNWRLAAASQ